MPIFHQSYVNVLTVINKAGTATADAEVNDGGQERTAKERYTDGSGCIGKQG